MAELLQRAEQLLCGWTCACECLRESARSLLQWESGSEWLYGLWLPSIIRRSNWLQLLIAGPTLLSCKQRSSGIIIAYFQRGILQISSYWVPRLHASEPGYCSSGGLPSWHWHRSRWSFVFCLRLSHFQQWHGLDLHHQIYKGDKSLYTNNLQSFNTLFCQNK